LDDPYKQIARYGESELYSEPLTLEEEWARVEAVTRDAMAHLARQILTPEKLNVILVGPLSGDLRREVMRLTDAF
ncbi:MAG: insulinase family protein, partial [Nitrospinaceae bacterium]